MKQLIIFLCFYFFFAFSFHLFVPLISLFSFIGIVGPKCGIIYVDIILHCELLFDKELYIILSLTLQSNAQLNVTINIRNIQYIIYVDQLFSFCAVISMGYQISFKLNIFFTKLFELFNKTINIQTIKFKTVKLYSGNIIFEQEGKTTKTKRKFFPIFLKVLYISNHLH